MHVWRPTACLAVALAKAETFGVLKAVLPILAEYSLKMVRRPDMSANMNLTESQMAETFNKTIAGRVKFLTSPDEAVFTEFQFKGRGYLGGYDYYRQQYYVVPASSNEAAQKRPKTKGTIISVRTKQAKSTRTRQFQVAQS
jgi:hypothetical protein